MGRGNGLAPDDAGSVPRTMIAACVELTGVWNTSAGGRVRRVAGRGPCGAQRVVGHWLGDASGRRERDC